VRALVAAGLVLLLVAGPASAWTFHGDSEPSTAADRDDGFMWPDATGTLSGLQVFFDVVPEASSTGQNPNDATLGVGARLAPPSTSYTAYLGVWRDCNGDGYLGALDGALLDYPAPSNTFLGATANPTLGTSSAACPPHSLWNNDDWIHELLWIGPQTWSPNPGDITYVIPGLLNDTTARVWGDNGLPGSSPEPSCAAWPLPRGTTSSTGGALAFADCFDQHAVASALGFSDPEHPERSANPLDQHLPVSPFGDPSAPGGPRTGLLERDADRPAFTVWDCTQPRATAVKDPQGHRSVDVADPEPASDGYVLSGSKGVEGIAQVAVFDDDPNGGPPTFHRDLTDADGTYAAAPAPASPGAPDAGGSFLDSAQDAEVGLVEQCDPHRDVVPMLGLGPGPLTGKLPLPESDDRGVSPSDGRRQNDFAFDFQQMGVSNQEGGTIPQGNLGFPGVGDLVGHGLSLQDGGLAALRDVNGQGPGWHSASEPLLGPKTLTRGDTQPPAARHLTFYARTSLVGVSLPGGLGFYGEEACQSGIGRNAGVQDGWDCDPADWGSRLRNRFSGDALGAAVGDAYQLRDVDCADDGAGPVSPALAGGCS